jgi:putative addiction module component (TIGR02574 family)
MTVDSIAPEALKLPLYDRIQLAASLWESIEDPYTLSADMSDEDAIALSLSRDAEIESGEVSAISHSDLMARLRG